MAGHSKWKQIKRKKAVTDQRRGALFTKLIREITIAAKQGGGERAVKKGTGELEGVTYEEVTYEAYGPGGAALLIEATTDNANRTVAEIRNAFQRHSGNLGATNSVAWMFDRKAQIALIPKSTVKVDGKDAKHLLALIEALEEMDDVAKVSSNFDIDAEALAAATACTSRADRRADHAPSPRHPRPGERLLP